RVRTETIAPPASTEPVPPAATMPQEAPPALTSSPAPATAAAKPKSRVPSPPGDATQPEIITDLSRLPPRVARMRERILEAARSGNLDKVVTVMQSNETMPIFSFGNDKDPIAYWRSNYPDSEGLEILAILINILETGFVRIDQGTLREMYVWP